MKRRVRAMYVWKRPEMTACWDLLTFLPWMRLSSLLWAEKSSKLGIIVLISLKSADRWRAYKGHQSVKCIVFSLCVVFHLVPPSPALSYIRPPLVCGVRKQTLLINQLIMYVPTIKYQSRSSCTWAGILTIMGGGGVWTPPPMISAPGRRREKWRAAFESSRKIISKSFRSFFGSGQNWGLQGSKFQNFPKRFFDNKIFNFNDRATNLIPSCLSRWGASNHIYEGRSISKVKYVVAHWP